MIESSTWAPRNSNERFIEILFAERNVNGNRATTSKALHAELSKQNSLSLANNIKFAHTEQSNKMFDL